MIGFTEPAKCQSIKKVCTIYIIYGTAMKWGTGTKNFLEIPQICRIVRNLTTIVRA
jgi:hypothetical protein